jgi:hypothetical protein
MVIRGAREVIEMTETGQETEDTVDKEALKHVGGVNDNLGGVDPRIDENLIRLSGGP